MEYLFEILIGVLPVFAFLLLLIAFDSFKLVRIENLTLAIFLGIVAAGLSFILINLIMNVFSLNYTYMTVSLAPGIEEIIKTLCLIFLIIRGRAGFMIDGAILGLAIGAGFAAVENIIFINYESPMSFAVHLVRGFGTAIMHGGVTAIAGIIAMYFITKMKKVKFIYFLPGLLVAILVHWLFNQFFLSPVVSAIIIIFFIPALMIVIFIMNEKSLTKWLNFEFDDEISLLNDIRNGNFSGTHPGKYFLQIKNKFQPEVVVDMLCYFQTYMELSIRAKSVIMQREAGLNVAIDNTVDAKLKELHHLKHSIGRTGIIAMSPILPMGHKELWKMNILEEGVGD